MRRSQGTVNTTLSETLICWKRTFLHWSLIVKSQQKRIELVTRPGNVWFQRAAKVAKSKGKKPVKFQGLSGEQEDKLQRILYEKREEEEEELSEDEEETQVINRAIDKVLIQTATSAADSSQVRNIPMPFQKLCCGILRWLRDLFQNYGFMWKKDPSTTCHGHAIN